MSENTSRLEPCPFCGKTDSEDNAVQEAAVALHSVKSPMNNRAYEVQCVCGAKGPRSLDAHEACVSWNIRHHTPSIEQASS